MCISSQIRDNLSIQWAKSLDGNNRKAPGIGYSIPVKKKIFCNLSRLSIKSLVYAFSLSELNMNGFLTNELSSTFLPYFSRSIRYVLKYDTFEYLTVILSSIIVLHKYQG